MPKLKNDRFEFAILGFALYALCLLFSGSAQALLLKVDPLHSQIVMSQSPGFCALDPSTGQFICPPITIVPQTFSVTGNVDVNVVHNVVEAGIDIFGNPYPSYGYDVLNVNTAGIFTDAYGEGFRLGDFSTQLVGENFSPFPSRGTWDGHTLTLNGAIYENLFRVNPFVPFPDTGPLKVFNFTIVAAAVPEPSTLPLIGLLLPLTLYLGFRSKTKSCKSI